MTVWLDSWARLADTRADDERLQGAFVDDTGVPTR
jgi:hypothetical protein